MTIKKIINQCLILFLLTVNLFAQEFSVTRIEPPNWWVGMNLNKIQLMIYGNNLKDANVKFDDSRIKISKIHNVENSDYLFVDIEIPSDLKPKEYKLIISKNNYEQTVSYPIYKRDDNKNRFQGFNSSDVIYLITPDRFADGDTTNNIVDGYLNEFARNNPYGRHGGDIQGIINHLNYIKDLGVTAIWINPLLENNGRESYHGYATTDYYKIDPRFGTNELYKNLTDEAHELGLKIIFDHINNHCGINHWWMKDLPMKDWLNGSVENHFLSNHNKFSISDIYSDSSSRNKNIKGWFTDYMPDLNQQNPFVANYLIQNTIWWIEYTGLDGIREDTYPYSDQKFLSDWGKIILDEYPNFNIVGEIWLTNTSYLAYYQKDSYLPREFNSYLPCVMDFGSLGYYYDLLSGKNGLLNLYTSFCKDYLFPDPENILTFLDNHDYQRAMYSANGNVEQFKLAIGLLLTTRGIPQLLYGTEIGMKGERDHGRLRMDFPGGFSNDLHNAFSSNGRTEIENEIFNYVKKLLELRKNYNSLSEGKLIHFIPEDEVYFYFKILNNEKILCIANNNESAQKVNLNQVKEILNGKNQFYDLLNDKKIIMDESTHNNLEINVERKSFNIFLIK